jgi:hypothetical protein
MVDDKQGQRRREGRHDRICTTISFSLSRTLVRIEPREHSNGHGVAETSNSSLLCIQPATILRIDATHPPLRLLTSVYEFAIEASMDLIERLFGVFPDGGNGALELVLIVLPLLAGGLIWIVRHSGRSPA